MSTSRTTPEICLSVTRWLAGLSLAGAVAVAAGLYAIARPDLVLVERVEFVGNHRAEASSLRHLVDVRNGTSIWSVDAAASARGAERHPWVKHARAWRRFPDTLVVEVEEYEPVALLQGEHLRYVDRDGTAFLRARSDDLDYPLLSGVDPALAQTHPDLPRLVVRDALWLLDAVDARGIMPRERVSEISFHRARGFTVHVARGARVSFGLERLDHRLGRLERLIADGRVDPGAPLLIDLAPPSLAIVRPLPVPGANGVSSGS